MNIIVHRGSHQIGGSCIELTSKNSRIILDIGEELPNLGDSGPKAAVLPEVEGLFKNQARKIDGVLISHGHGDHIGLLQDILPEIPLYIGEKALKIYDMTSQFTGKKTISNPTFYFESGKKILIGDFAVTPYLVDHSGFDAYAFLIENEGQYIVYTGDIRYHGRKKNATRYFVDSIPKNIDLLLVEGTMMSRITEKTLDEEEIEKKAYDFMKAYTAPIFVLQSSTNIDRLVGMYRAAKRSGRIFVMDIFTAHIVAQLNDSIPRPGKYNDVRVFYPYHLTKRMFKAPEGERLMKEFSSYRISREELSKKTDYCMIIRDTMLSDLEHIENLQGAGFIYSMWNGYKKQKRMNEILEYARVKNMNIIDLHTSGHASAESLQTIIQNTEAKKIVPVHTENPDLFVEKFKNVQIVKDGELISV